MERFDVVVAGGGPAGAAAAIAAARHGLRVLLAERGGEARRQVGEGLPPAARRLLRELGADDAFLAGGHAPAWGLHSVWGSPRLSCVDHLRDPDGHGWRLDRARFDACLRERAAAVGVSLRPGVRLTGLKPAAPGGGFELAAEILAGPEAAGCPAGPSRRCRFAASWLVDATGRAARFARQLGPPPLIADRLIGLSVVLDAAPDDRDGTTLVEAVPEGWWYSARLPGATAGGRRVVIFFTDHDLPAARRARTPEGFAALLAAAREVRRRLQPGGASAPSPPRLEGSPLAPPGIPRAHPAATSRLARPAGACWIAVGDAAVACDPLASQGILTALYSGLLAGEALAAAQRGDAAPLAAYPAALAAVFDAYWRHRALYYCQEGRFAGEPFWRRRHGSPAPAGGGALDPPRR